MKLVERFANGATVTGFVDHVLTSSGCARTIMWTAVPDGGPDMGRRRSPKTRYGVAHRALPARRARQQDQRYDVMTVPPVMRLRLVL